jgi:hypothetical protein
VFEIEKTITLRTGEVIDGSVGIGAIAERFKDSGHIVKFKFCSRCGLTVNMTGGALLIPTGTFVNKG